MYKITKLFTGFSTCFRQFGAVSHCKYLHGYALQFKVTIKTSYLDRNNWVSDYGGFKDFKLWLKHWFDHTCFVTLSDPEIETFKKLKERGIIQLRITDKISIEMFAQMVYEYLEKQLPPKIKLESVECIETPYNSAIYCGDK